MGLVSQEPVLFNDTIRANIAYGKEGNATEAEILEAAAQANAHSFISGLQQVGKSNPLKLALLNIPFRICHYLIFKFGEK